MRILPQPSPHRVCVFASAIAGLLVLANVANAAPPKLAITAPSEHAVVGKTLPVTTRLPRSVGRHHLRYRIDGRLVAAYRSRSRTASRTLNVSKLSEGAHVVTVAASFRFRGRLRRAARSVGFVVARPTPGDGTVGGLAVPTTPAPQPTPPVGPPQPPDTTAPSAPSGVVATPQAGGLLAVSWNAATDNRGIAGYFVLVNGQRFDVGIGLTATLTGIECERERTIAVGARDAAGNSAASAPLAITTGACAAPSGIPTPIADLPGWRLIFAENFEKPAATGSWGSATDPAKIVYTGARGTSWVTYPANWLDTYDKRPYRSDKVLSVHDGVLDFHLQTVDGQPAGANPSPVITGSSQYQTYGRYSARMRVENTDLSEFYVAWLLWPQAEGDWELAESDFPEQSLVPGNTGVMGVFHFGVNKQQIVFTSPSTDIHEWHTYTQEWLPGTRRYYIDDTLLYEVQGLPVYSGPQRWQLQTETKGDGAHNGHLEIDWATVHAYAP